jgi:AmiR/NasT family two-component response regulator
VKLIQAIHILQGLERELPKAHGALSTLSAELQKIRNGVASVIGSGINPEALRGAVAVANKGLEEVERLQTDLAAIGRTIKEQLP